MGRLNSLRPLHQVLLLLHCSACFTVLTLSHGSGLVKEIMTLELLGPGSL